MENVYFYVNNIYIYEGGIYVVGFCSVLMWSLNNYGKWNDFFKKMNVIGDDFWEGLIVVILIWIFNL